MQTTTNSPTKTLLERRQVLGPAYRLFYDEPLAPLRGDDVWLYDLDGRKYLDAYNNVPVVGHCHPHVVQAMTRQASRLNTHTRYLHDSVLSYAERLLSKFPAPLDTAMFTCTGSEANDLAVRVARAATGATGFIVTRNAYHGVTSALADLSPSLQPVIGTHVRSIPSPETLQHLSQADAALAMTEYVDEAVASLIQAGLKPAALMVDTVFASDGIYTSPSGVLAAAAKAIRSHGGLFIADEVQGGFGRSGGQWWAFQRDPFVPDMVTLGKPMGNGHPLAGLVLRADIAAEFAKRGRYFNTFGGNPVSAEVGMAVLDVIEQNNLLEQVSVVGDYLGCALQELAHKHRSVVSTRGAGLYRAVELVNDQVQDAPASELASRVVNHMRQAGVLLSACGPQANVLKIRPPLTFKQAHVDVLIASLDHALTYTRDVAPIFTALDEPED